MGGATIAAFSGDHETTIRTPNAGVDAGDWRVSGAVNLRTIPDTLDLCMYQ
jgi:hypothetical protein